MIIRGDHRRSSNVENVPSSRRPLIAILAAAVAATTMTACARTSSGTGLRIGKGVAGTPRPHAIAFRDCTTQLLSAGVPVPHALKGTMQFGCAAMPVPLDYTRPDGPTIDLGIVRIHTTQNTTAPVQSMLVNPGGPGGSGLNFSLGLLGQISPDVVRHFDIIGFDPRGVGESSPIRCLTDKQKDAFLAESPNTLTAGGIRDEYRLDRQFSHECASEVGPTLRYYNTVNTARDMDQIRQAVGDDVMNYLGFSYGTELGWTYAHLFPQEVHTFVLDGVVDPTQIHNEDSIAQLKGFEDAFGQFAKWCVKAPVCADLHDPTATAEHLFASTLQTPLATGTPRKLTSSLASTGVLEALYSKSDWPKLADALTAATRGNGSGLLQLADKYNQRSADGTYQNIIDANATISCNDAAAHKPPSVAKVLARSKVLAKRFPIFAGTGGGSGASCLGWQPHRTPIPPPTAATPKPVLVIGNLHDPATPYEGAVHLAAEMGNADLLSWDGEGHTSYLNGSSCIDRYVNDYLIHSTLPPKNKVCPAK